MLSDTKQRILQSIAASALLADIKAPEAARAVTGADKTALELEDDTVLIVGREPDEVEGVDDEDDVFGLNAYIFVSRIKRHARDCTR